MKESNMQLDFNVSQGDGSNANLAVAKPLQHNIVTAIVASSSISSEICDILQENTFKFIFGKFDEELVLIARNIISGEQM